MEEAGSQSIVFPTTDQENRIVDNFQQILLKHFLQILPVLLLLLRSQQVLFAQKTTIVHRIICQDTNTVQNNKTWVTASTGIFLTYKEISILNGEIDINRINRKYHYLKVRSAYHHYTRLYGKDSQKSLELNLMTGKLYSFRGFSVSYGLGIMAGIRRIDTKVTSNGSSLISFSGAPFSTRRFLVPCIPVDFSIHSGCIGAGIDLNLNPYLPYVGTKLNFQMGGYRIEK